MKKRGVRGLFEAGRSLGLVLVGCAHSALFYSCCSHALQSHGASHTHLPPTIAAQNGTAGSTLTLETIGHDVGGQKKVVAFMPGQHA